MPDTDERGIAAVMVLREPKAFEKSISGCFSGAQELIKKTAPIVPAAKIFSMTPGIFTFMKTAPDEVHWVGFTCMLNDRR